MYFYIFWTPRFFWKVVCCKNNWCQVWCQPKKRAPKWKNCIKKNQFSYFSKSDNFVKNVVLSKTSGLCVFVSWKKMIEAICGKKLIIFYFKKSLKVIFAFFPNPKIFDKISFQKKRPVSNVLSTAKFDRIPLQKCKFSYFSKFENLLKNYCFCKNIALKTWIFVHLLKTENCLKKYSIGKTINAKCGVFEKKIGTCAKMERLHWKGVHFRIFQK